MTARTPVRGRYDLYHGQTPAQTLGPFFHQGLVRSSGWRQSPGVREDAVRAFDSVLAAERSAGQALRLEGSIYDGQGEPVADALVELWQANAHGHYQHPLDASAGPLDAAFRGFGRAATNATGGFSFVTIKPGCVAGPTGSVQAPHLNLIVGARGLTRHAFTRVYFAGDAELARDPVLALVPAERRHTLLAERLDADASAYRFDIRLQGENETVFFEI